MICPQLSLLRLQTTLRWAPPSQPCNSHTCKLSTARQKLCKRLSKEKQLSKLPTFWPSTGRSPSSPSRLSRKTLRQLASLTLSTRLSRVQLQSLAPPSFLNHKSQMSLRFNTKSKRRSLQSFKVSFLLSFLLIIIDFNRCSSC